MPLHKHENLEFQVIIGEISQTMNDVLIQVEVYERKIDPDEYWESYREKIDVLEGRALKTTSYETTVLIAKKMIEKYKDEMPCHAMPIKPALAFYEGKDGKWYYTQGEATYSGFSSLKNALGYFNNNPHGGD